MKSSQSLLLTQKLHDGYIRICTKTLNKPFVSCFNFYIKKIWIKKCYNKFWIMVSISVKLKFFSLLKML